VYRYAGRATDRQWISAELNPDGQRVKVIEVVESPSWVAWRRRVLFFSDAFLSMDENGNIWIQNDEFKVGECVKVFIYK